MEQLNLDVDHYAISMADLLAIMHWKAQIDANDVEFVLAPQRLTSADSTQSSPIKTPSINRCDSIQSPTISTINSVPLGEYDIWILDFDCCHDMTMDTAGVDQAWQAFYTKDAYYP